MAVELLSNQKPCPVTVGGGVENEGKSRYPKVGMTSTISQGLPKAKFCGKFSSRWAQVRLPRTHTPFRLYASPLCAELTRERNLRVSTSETAIQTPGARGRGENCQRGSQAPRSLFPPSPSPQTFFFPPGSVLTRSSGRCGSLRSASHWLKLARSRAMSRRCGNGARSRRPPRGSAPDSGLWPLAASLPPSAPPPPRLTPRLRLLSPPGTRALRPAREAASPQGARRAPTSFPGPLGGPRRASRLLASSPSPVRSPRGPGIPASAAEPRHGHGLSAASRPQPRSLAGNCRRVLRNLRLPSTWRSACSAEGRGGVRSLRSGPGPGPDPCPLRGTAKPGPEKFAFPPETVGKAERERFAAGGGSHATQHTPTALARGAWFSGGRKLSSGEQQVVPGSRIKASCLETQAKGTLCPFLKSAGDLLPSPLLIFPDHKIEVLTSGWGRRSRERLELGSFVVTQCSADASD